MKKLVKPRPPRYDNVFYEGVRWLDWIARCEDRPVCVYFQNIDHGIECSAFHCPCDLYEKDENK